MKQNFLFTIIILPVIIISCSSSKNVTDNNLSKVEKEARICFTVRWKNDEWMAYVSK